MSMSGNLHLQDITCCMKIETNFGYLIAMIVIESYLQKGFHKLSETEDRHLDELSTMVEKWEMNNYQ